MSAITGRAKKHDGTAIDYVSIFNWEDGRCIAQVMPNAAGDWSYTYSNDLKVGITYVADGCEPITHGAYEFIIPWTPLKLQPKLYLDNDSAVWAGGVGSNINSWVDLSGNQSDFLRIGSVTKTEDNSLSISTGNNGLYNSSLKTKSILSGIGKAWIFMVIKPKSSSLTALMVTDSSGRKYTPRLGIQYDRGVFTMLSARNNFISNNFFDTNPAASNEYYMVLLEHDWQTGRVAWHINGAADRSDDNHIADKGLTNASPADNNVYIGQYPTSNNASFHEQKSIIIGTDQTLSQSDIDKLFGYAAHKHGLTDKLPADHPYKTDSPA